MEDAHLPLVKSSKGLNTYCLSTPTLSSDSDLSNGTPEIKVKMTQEKQHLGLRLRRRKELINQRKVIVDLSFTLGMIGIILVIVDTELRFTKQLQNDSTGSVGLKVVTSVTSAFLLISITAYHITGIKLHMVTAGLEDWRLVVTYRTWLRLAIEILICSFHPLPVGNFTIPTKLVSISNPRPFPINAVLTILMFPRLYLFGRFVVFHSELFRDTSVQSLGALSKVNINAQFVFKALMSTAPGLVLCTIILAIVFIDAWILRVCEVYSDPDNIDEIDYSQTLWLTTVTFLTLGYGDVVPASYCGRFVSIFTGLLGVGMMALSVAVLAKKLEQSRSEKYVHTFVRRIKFDKDRRHAASNVLKQSIRIWRLKKSGHNLGSKEIVYHRSKLIQAIRKMNESKALKSQIQDNIISNVEISKGVSELSETTQDIREEQEAIQRRLESIEQLMANVSFQMYEIRESLKLKSNS